MFKHFQIGIGILRPQKKNFGSHCFVDWVFSCKRNLRTISAKSEHFSRNRSIWVLQIQNFFADCSDLKELKEHLRKMYQKKDYPEKLFFWGLGIFRKTHFSGSSFFRCSFSERCFQSPHKFLFFFLLSMHMIPYLFGRQYRKFDWTRWKGNTIFGPLNGPLNKLP